MILRHRRVDAVFITGILQLSMTSPASSNAPGVLFARRVFAFAGWYGLLALLPQYGMENRVGTDFPPAITHPEYFYGFLGVAIAWQLAFLVISRDPLRFRPLMLPAVVEKATFGVAAIVLLWQHRIPAIVFGFAMFDLVLGALFLASYIATGAKPYPRDLS